MFHTTYRVPRGDAAARARTGTSPATRRPASGSSTASKLAKRDLFYGSYPITPASDILHQLSTYKHFGVKTFQAEDEIAAIGAAIGAAYGGALGADRHVGPRHRAQVRGHGPRRDDRAAARRRSTSSAPGPSTGMPTKTEQADLLQVLFGRNGESPIPIVAPATPGECFTFAIEAVADRAQVHDPGRVPVGRLRRQRRRAVAGARRSTTCRTSPSRTHAEREATFLPYPATRRRSPGRGPCPARPASSTASAASRRPTASATSATTPRTTTG